MTGHGEDILAFLDAAITAREKTARSAAVSFMGVPDGGTWVQRRDSHRGGYMISSPRGEERGAVDESVAFAFNESAATFITLNDPTSILRRCAADRKLIAEHGPFSANDLGCKGCGLDGHEDLITGYYEDCPVLCVLAEGYGWTEGER